MKNQFMLKLSLSLLIITVCLTAVKAQDSVKKTVVKKTIVTNPVVNPIRPGTVPINPKTGRPYSRYGYGAYARHYRARLKADSIKKAAAAGSPIKVSTTTIATTPPDVKPDTPVITTASRVDKSLNGQYQYLLTKVFSYQRPFVEAFWKNFTDTLRSNRAQLKNTQDKLAEQAKTISSLQAGVAAREQQLTQTDSISFLGAEVTKTTYNIIMWGLVLLVGTIAAVVIARSGSSRKEAAYRTTLYNELEEEFKTFKAKANEKEKKLARELQTERNKVDELTGRG
ncbi:hypothetical protein [Mucilaginibacter sp. UR6-11]|uniref:hypothetical protein n=1 Tax=Mucilaginibacter sp. UR6-11 TaxID=1435644 RepID=UPI001E2CAF38|nr:hypothetical protein [Mucilaginibacter sp. UR6-11]MCC8424198.1 hypothetical protein [Mucilaginibacter sp. UR6-11]